MKTWMCAPALVALLTLSPAAWAASSLSDEEMDRVSAAGDVCSLFFGINGPCIASVTQVFMPGGSTTPGGNGVNANVNGQNIVQQPTVTQQAAQALPQPTPVKIKQNVAVTSPGLGMITNITTQVRQRNKWFP